MKASPLATAPLWHLGALSLTAPVVVTWAIMACIVAASVLLTRRLALVPSKAQTVLELLVTTLDAQIRDTIESDPAPYRALIGTLFLFVLVANWSPYHHRLKNGVIRWTLLGGVKLPTGSIV